MAVLQRQLVPKEEEAHVLSKAKHMAKHKVVVAHIV